MWGNYDTVVRLELMMVADNDAGIQDDIDVNTFTEF